MASVSALRNWSASLSSIYSRLALIPTTTGLRPIDALTQFLFVTISLGGFCFNHSISIDDELSLFPESTANLALQGRFGLEALFMVMRPVVLPLLPYLLLAIAYVVSYTIILSIHGLKHSWRSHIGFLVFILFPVNWLNQEYSGLAVGMAAGLICVSVAAVLTQQSLRPDRQTLNPLICCLISVALLVFSIGCYQSFITLYLALGIGSVVLSMNPSPYRANQRRGRIVASFLLNASAAVVMHTVFTKTYLALSGQTMQQINVYYRSPYFMLRTEPVAYLTGNAEQLIRTYLTPGFFYGHSLWAFAWIVVGSIGMYLFCDLSPSTHTQSAASADSDSASELLVASPPQPSQSMVWRRSHFVASILLVGALLAIPLALNIFSKPFRIPMRAELALPYVAFLCSMLWLETTNHSRQKRALGCGVILSTVLIAQCSLTVSHYYAARDYQNRSDQLVAATIASALIALPATTTRVDHLLSSGALKRDNPYATGWYSSAQGSFFNWDNGNDARISAWLRAVGLPRLKPAESDRDLAPQDLQRMRVKLSSMPAWPQPGSITIDANVVLIKLSD